MNRGNLRLKAPGPSRSTDHECGPSAPLFSATSVKAESPGKEYRTID